MMTHIFILPRGKKNQGGVLLSEIYVHKWFSNPNHRAKCVGGMMFELVTENKEMNKLDALRLKKYHQYFIKQNWNKDLEYL